MMCRILAVLASVVLVVMVTTADANAAHSGRANHRGWRNRTVYNTVTKQTVKRGVYPRLRQVDGRTLWDLGKQKGQWPSLR